MAITDQGRPRALVADTLVKVRFTDDGRVVVNAGCNTLSGPVTVDGGTLRVADMSVTEIGCDPARHEQDEFLVDLFAGNLDYRLDGDHLVLGSSDRGLELNQERTLPLIGTVWKADTVIEGTMAGAVPAGVHVTLVFGPDQVEISGLCNLDRADYRTTGPTITFRPGQLTRKACQEDITSLEQATLAVLDGEATYSIDTDMLTLTKGDRGLRFTTEG
ncbi:META domain-containing protein [Umezawaea sp. Da 62-37]|uniref:META domain-containing protein n=1 Tax=Umezawaea sp. Da 62-37 TaxID=3075927 RepID=UPI0028F70CDC|nr:META domain-containing protein [Umezawaea sp. Da 62-37]WNV87731.1 META domain-containing protein [Umezawaea sp. Da 62-37]